MARWRDSRGRLIKPTCTQGVRHWFTAWGSVGERIPWCVRCGAPNPRCPRCGGRTFVHDDDGVLECSACATLYPPGVQRVHE